MRSPHPTGSPSTTFPCLPPRSHNNHLPTAHERKATTFFIHFADKLRTRILNFRKGGRIVSQLALSELTSKKNDYDHAYNMSRPFQITNMLLRMFTSTVINSMYEMIFPRENNSKKKITYRVLWGKKPPFCGVNQSLPA